MTIVRRLIVRFRCDFVLNDGDVVVLHTCTLKRLGGNVGVSKLSLWGMIRSVKGKDGSDVSESSL